MEATTLQRLLKYPHAAVFDKAPAQELAFLLRHPDAVAWRVADRVLTVTVDEVDSIYALADFNVGELVDQLRSDGFEVTNLTNEYRYLSALALVEGEGDQLVSNGDRLHVFTSLLWVILSCYAAEVAEAGSQIQQALRQMVITTSEGEWLDLWGTLYADARRSGESDAAYAARIPVEAFRIRENPGAIEIAIKEATGFDVRIEEPWTSLFRLDESTLSGPDKFYDGDYVGYHLIQPVAIGAIDWPSVLAVINRNRAAGVLVLGPRITYSSWVDATGAFVHFAMEQEMPRGVRYEDRAFLDTGSIEDVSIPNHPARLRREMRRITHVVTNQANYAVHARKWRDYREYQAGVVYEGQYWDQPLLRTWATSTDNSWTTSTVIGSKQTRES